MRDSSPGGVGPRRPRLRLIDLTALVLGYGLAALLVRSYWPRRGLPGPLLGLALALVYAWLGVTMAGPVLLVVNRRRGPGGTRHEGSGLTRAEQAWTLVGAYWIGLALIAVPGRTSLRAGLASLPVLVVLGALWGAGRLRSSPIDPARAWTQRAALGILVTWPLAWGLLILLGWTLG